MTNFLHFVQKGRYLIALVLLTGVTSGIAAQTVNVNVNVNVSVSGTVYDESGVQPLIGVTILELGTENGTVSDVDGHYSIQTATENAVLEFSYVGYGTVQETVNGRAMIDVTMDISSTTFEEVVVVGYGSMERQNVTGAITTVNSQVFEETPVPNAIEALRGQAAGVRVTRANGQPGSGVSFKVRGTNSIGVNPDDVGSANSPLIVVDGVPVTGGNLAEYNPNDIESINILKDAGAASIYGSSSANGVILITTKSGKAGKPRVEASYSYGVSDVVQEVDMMSAEQYVQFKRDARMGSKNWNGQPVQVSDVITDPVELANYVAGNNINWTDVLLQTGNTHRAGLSVNGGSESFKYYLSGDAYLDEGIVPYTDYNRYSVRTNGIFTPYSWLDIGTRVQLSTSKAEETGALEGIGDPKGLTGETVNYNATVSFQAYQSNSPLGRIYDETGQLVATANGDQFQYNPLWKWKESLADRWVNRTQINPYINVRILDGLTYQINGSAEKRYEKFKRFTSSVFDDGTRAGSPRTIIHQDGESSTYLLDNIVSYTKDLGANTLTATAVYGFQTLDIDRITIKGRGVQPNPDEGTSGDPLIFDQLGYHGLSQASGSISDANTNIYTSEGGWRKEYYIGRVGFSIQDKYVINATVRRDGSSRFGTESRWGTFPSVSFAWNMSNESFFSNMSNLHLLKLRASYGLLGNDGLSDFGYLSLANGISYPVGGALQSGYTTNPTSAPNSDLKWETSNQFNIGVDFGVGRFSGSLDYYNTKTKDLILSEILPITTGYTRVLSNVGESANWGIDARIKANIISTPDFGWTSTINWAKDKNKIVRLNRNSTDESGNPVDDITNGWFIGQDIDVVYGYEFVGIYGTSAEDIATAAEMHPDKPGYGPGDPIIVDQNGDGVITFEDQTFLGSPTPEWYGGWSNTFTYKGFELSVLIEAVSGVTKLNSYLPNLDARVVSNNIPDLEYWTPDNQDALYPQPSESTADIYYADAWKTQDASFVSLRNISLGYTLPKSVLGTAPINNIKIYVQGNNLKYWTDFEFAYSPETDIQEYPITRTFIGGIKVTF